MSDKELAEASFEAFCSLERLRNYTGAIERYIRDVKSYAADYENQDSDMKYARMLGLYEGFFSGLEHDISEMKEIVDKGHAASCFLVGE